MADAGSDEEQPEPTPASERLGRYRLVYELATGGMATVFMARAEGVEGFEKVVALKRIHPHLASQKSYVRMFLDEARLASRIQHPNVCPVIDFGVDEGEYFLVMEYLVGTGVNRVLRELSRRPERVQETWPRIASRMVADAAEGLHAAHELRNARGELLGVVHRDISPSNLFAGFDGVVRVVDFGIAKAEGRLHRTNTGELKGKFGYMSPEQVRSEEVDRRADVWALGVVLWEALTLRRLFRRKQEADTMYAVLEADVPRPSLHADVPRELDDLVSRALERDPERRVPDARTLSLELQKVWTSKDRQPAHAAEVTELLRTLFPGEEEHQRSLIEIGRQRRDSVPKIGSETPDSESFSGVETRATMPEKWTTAEPPRRAKAPLVAAAVVVAAVVGGVVVWAAAPWDPPRRPRSDAAQSTTPEQAAASGQDDGSGGGADDGERAAAPQQARNDRAGQAGSELDGGAETDDVAAAAAQREEPPRDTAAAERASADDGRRERTPPPGSTSRREAERPPANEEPEPAASPQESDPPSRGKVSVVVPGGWANVYDAHGRFVGATPLRHELPAGKQRLELRFGGEPPPVSVEVDVPAGETVRVTKRPP